MLLAAVPGRAIAPLVHSGRLVAGVSGEIGLAARCARLWGRSTGGTATLRDVHRLYRLGELCVPRSVDGRARPATAVDTEFLIACYAGFNAETAESAAVDHATAVADRLGFGGLWLWEDGSGEPVAIAGHTRTAADAIRVAPVFTRPDRRGRGYGSAVTAAISRHAQQCATHVVLFTDLTNPTSNSIYSKIGYRPVSDRAIFALEP